jgi:hypothetical protein
MTRASVSATLRCERNYRQTEPTATSSSFIIIHHHSSSFITRQLGARVIREFRRRGSKAHLMFIADRQQAPERAETRVTLDSPAVGKATTTIYAARKWWGDFNAQEGVVRWEIMNGIVRRRHEPPRSSHFHI